VGNVAFVAVVLAGWFLYLRPQSLGGPAEYVIVKGTSMRPTLIGGDLVVVRHHHTYQVGDVVAYRVPKGGTGAGTKIIHRIVGGSAREGFRFRGDNRTGDDLWHLRPSQILGRRWIRLPRGGRYLLSLRRPLTIAVIAGALAFLAALAWLPRPNKEGRPAEAQ
jgi:signal peptidase I